jgi:hypothetical protein
MSNNRSGVSKFGDSEHSFFLSKKIAPLQYPYYFKRDNVPPAFICFGRFIVGAILRRDILHD